MGGIIDENYRNELLNRDDLQSEYSVLGYPYKYSECDIKFTKLSGLFQHIYSKACDQRLDEGKMAKLIKWLKNRHNMDEDD